MRDLLVVVDDNVNARIICEVLLEARGEPCLLCSQREAHECLHHLHQGGVILIDTNLADPMERQKLQALVEALQSRHTQAAVLLVTDAPAAKAVPLPTDWPNSVLHPKHLGAALLSAVDSLRGQRGNPASANA